MAAKVSPQIGHYLFPVATSGDTNPDLESAIARAFNFEAELMHRNTVDVYTLAINAR